MTETITTCDRCGSTVPDESRRMRLTLRVPDSAGPAVRFLCPPCCWSLSAWFDSGAPAGPPGEVPGEAEPAGVAVEEA